MGNTRIPSSTYAAINPVEEERIRSSSGGLFTYIAKKIIMQGGVVFGAQYDEYWNVVHSYTDKTQELGRFRGSKYVQSKIGKSFIDCKKFLKDGRPVLFTGTPCQIKALKLFLKRDYANLYTADFVCHGVPSKTAWQSYLTETLEPNMQKKAERSSEAGKNTVLSLSLNTASAIADIVFRDKNDYGWEKYCFVIRKKSGNKARQNSVLTSDIHYNNPYFSLFLSHVMERYSCYDCPAKAGKSESDMTMGDYWGIDYDDIITNDNKGVSLLMVHSDKGRYLAEGLILSERTYEHAVSRNPMIAKSLKASKLRVSMYDIIKVKGILSTSCRVRRLNTAIRAMNKLLHKLHISYQVSI